MYKFQVEFLQMTKKQNKIYQSVPRELLQAQIMEPSKMFARVRLL